MFFPVVKYGCESWTIKKAESQRIDAFELQCWRRLLRAPWTARRSNQSIPKEINPEYSLEGLILKLKLQYFGHLMWRADSFEKTLIPGKIEGSRRRGGWDGWMASRTQCTWVWASSGSRRWTGKPDVLWSMEFQRFRHDWGTELNWGFSPLHAFIPSLPLRITDSYNQKGLYVHITQSSCFGAEIIEAQRT